MRQLRAALPRLAGVLLKPLNSGTARGPDRPGDQHACAQGRRTIL